MVAALVASAALAPSCASTPVHYGLNADRPRETAVWVAAGRGRRRLVGYVYAYDDLLRDPRVRAARGFILHAGRAAKIAWFPRRDLGRELVVEGVRIDGPGEFAARYPRAIGTRAYPSGITLPSAGCWRLTFRTGGGQWTVVVEGIDPPTHPQCEPTPVEYRPHPLDAFFRNWVAAEPSTSRLSATFEIWQPGVDGAATYSGGRTPSGANTKVLWLLDRPTDSVHQRELSIVGRRLDGVGELSQRERENVAGGGLFPSHLRVPAAGCWLVKLRVGNDGGALVLRAFDP